MVFTVFSMVFTTAVELAFRRHSMLKAQSTKAWYLLCLAWCSQAQSSWLFKVTAILKAQSSNAWYLLCLARLSRAGSVFSKAQCRAGEGCRAKYGIYCVQQGPFVGLVEQSMVFTVFSKSWRRLSSKAWYLQCLTRLIRRLSRAKHCIYCV